MRYNSTLKFILLEHSKYYLTEDDTDTPPTEETDTKEETDAKEETEVKEEETGTEEDTWTKEGYQGADGKKSWEELFKIQRRPTGGIPDSWEKMSRDQLWDKYYTVVWGDGNKTLNKSAQAVKNLGDAFVEEAYTFGFAKATNPFISFLEKVLYEAPFNTDPAFKRLFDTKTNFYKALHNAFSLKYITKDDLTNPGADSLIWWPALYTLGNGNEMLARLKDTSKANVTKILDKINTAVDTVITRKQYLGAIYSDKFKLEGNINDTPEKVYEAIIKLLTEAHLADSSYKAKFKDANTLNVLVKVLKTASGVNDESEKKVASDKDVEKLWTTTLKTEIKTAKTALKFFSYLIMQASDTTKSAKILTTAGVPFDTTKAGLSIDEYNKCKKWLKAYDLGTQEKVDKFINNLLKLEDLRKILSL